MKNLLDDPEVMQLYKSLQTKRFENVDDFLTSNPTDLYNEGILEFKPHKLPERKMFFGGEEVEDFIGDNDYGL